VGTRNGRDFPGTDDMHPSRLPSSSLCLVPLLVRLDMASSRSRMGQVVVRPESVAAFGGVRKHDTATTGRARPAP
jgi:hypothetical protein